MKHLFKVISILGIAAVLLVPTFGAHAQTNSKLNQQQLSVISSSSPSSIDKTLKPKEKVYHINGVRVGEMLSQDAKNDYVDPRVRQEDFNFIKSYIAYKTKSTKSSSTTTISPNADVCGDCSWIVVRKSSDSFYYDTKNTVMYTIAGTASMLGSLAAKAYDQNQTVGTFLGGLVAAAYMDLSPVVYTETEFVKYWSSYYDQYVYRYVTNTYETSSKSTLLDTEVTGVYMNSGGIWTNIYIF